MKLTWMQNKELPARELITSVHDLCFNNDKLLLVNLDDRGWDIPGGHIESEACFKREAYEEGYITGSCFLLGYIEVNHHENIEWNSKGTYESGERTWIDPGE